METGVQLPVVEGEWTPRWDDLREMALHAEAIGLDSLWIPDHLLFRRDGATRGVWESWSVLAALAAVTTRIKLGTLVLCLPFRDPARTAEMAATVDAISGGRLILGVGAGWHQPEFDAFGIPFERRVTRFEEALALLRERLPRRVPIMVGTRGPRMLALTARYADLWNTGLVGGRNWPDAVPPLRAMIDAACLAVGRDPATLGRTINPLVLTLPHAADPMLPGADPIRGTPEQIAAALAGFSAEGISHLQLLLNPNTPAGLRALEPVLRQLDR
jgi:alkanesulfonate monooxygenase SsuD/methylene tetrahydromethanopterin reductase-like flavin-dependent oxidoreductase (luciferase family)